MPADGEIVIETDIPCAQCGYNLRTLGREGRCPECGEEIWPSIQKFNTNIERWPPLIAESAESLTSRFEGCVLCIVAFVVNQSFWIVYMNMLFGRAYQPWMLGPSSATLVLLWWGLLKLALPRDSKSRQGVFTAVCATGSLLLPIITVYATDYRRQFRGSFQIFLQVAMPVMWLLAVIAVPMSFAVLAKWLRRAGRPIFAILAIMCFAMQAWVAIRGWGLRYPSFFRSSLELLWEFPQPLIGLQVEAIIPFVSLRRSPTRIGWTIVGTIAQFMTMAMLVILAIDFARARAAVRLSLRDRNASEC